MTTKSTQHTARTDAALLPGNLGQVVRYHAPGGQDYAALVVAEINGTTYLRTFIEEGQPATEGTDTGQWSAIEPA